MPNPQEAGLASATLDHATIAHEKLAHESRIAGGKLGA